MKRLKCNKCQNNAKYMFALMVSIRPNLDNISLLCEGCLEKMKLIAKGIGIKPFYRELDHLFNKIKEKRNEI